MFLLFYYGSGVLQKSAQLQSCTATGFPSKLASKVSFEGNYVPSVESIVRMFDYIRTDSTVALLHFVCHMTDLTQTVRQHGELNHNHSASWQKQKGKTMSSQALDWLQNVVRYVGIRPRVKVTADNEARPTQVAIHGPGDEKVSYELASEQDELDFVLGHYPTGFRKVTSGEDISMFLEHHIERDDDGNPLKVPAGFDGLKSGDLVSMVMGGSGDYLAFALSRKGEDIGARVGRITPFLLKSFRGEGVKDDDAKFLANLIRDKQNLFTPVYVRDRAIVNVRERQRQRIDIMKARIGCEQRLRQRFIGEVFCTPNGLFPQGAIEKEFDQKKANDVVLQNLKKEEAAANRELLKAVEATDVWKQVFSQVEGLGPAIAARLISVIQDIRRFENAGKLKKYLGAHVGEDGKFPRRRKGEVALWSNEGRGALFLLADQFNRRPDSLWGQKFLAIKAVYSARYPHPHLAFKHNDVEKSVVLEPGTFEKKGTKYIVSVEGAQIEVSGKMRYFKGHIHKMASKTVSTQFVEWLFAEWWKLEGRVVETSKPEEGEGESAAA